MATDLERALLEKDDQWWTKGNKFQEAFRRNVEENPQMDAYTAELAGMIPGVDAVSEFLETVDDALGRGEKGDRHVPWWQWGVPALALVPGGRYALKARRAEKKAQQLAEQALKAKKAERKALQTQAKEALDQAGLAKKEAWGATTAAGAGTWLNAKREMKYRAGNEAFKAAERRRELERNPVKPY